MTIRFMREWRGKSVGQTTDSVPDGVAQLLISRGIAEHAEKRSEPINGHHVSSNGAADAGRGEKPVLRSNERHNARRKANRYDSGGS